MHTSAPLTDQLLAEYRDRRLDALRRQRPSREPVPPPTPPAPDVLRTFSEAVAAGDVDPQEFAAFWVEAGSMSSGGSHNQLELPRRTSAFFGHVFADYDDEHHTLGHPQLLVGSEWFTDRPLTWHGNNRMERINLPTFHQSGLHYPDTAILFRRIEDGFSVEVYPWNSRQALAWRAESEAAGCPAPRCRVDR